MMHSNGEMEEVIRYLDDTTVEIKSKLLYQYAAAKQMVVLLFLISVWTLMEYCLIIHLKNS